MKNTVGAVIVKVILSILIGTIIGFVIALISEAVYALLAFLIVAVVAFFIAALLATNYIKDKHLAILASALGAIIVTVLYIYGYAYLYGENGNDVGGFIVGFTPYWIATYILTINLINSD